MKVFEIGQVVVFSPYRRDRRVIAEILSSNPNMVKVLSDVPDKKDIEATSWALDSAEPADALLSFIAKAK